MDSSDDKLSDAFMAHPAFRDLSANSNLTLDNFERAPPRVKCPAGYERTNKRLRDL